MYGNTLYPIAKKYYVFIKDLLTVRCSLLLLHLPCYSFSYYHAVAFHVYYVINRNPIFVENLKIMSRVAIQVNSYSRNLIILVK